MFSLTSFHYIKYKKVSSPDYYFKAKQELSNYLDKNRNLNTALIYFIQKGNDMVIEILLTTPEYFIEISNESIERALSLARHEGRFACVHHILSNDPPIR